jgi:hypothetical protein
MSFCDKATNYGSIHFLSGVGGDPLKLKGDFINEGIMNHDWVQVEKNIINHGIWSCQKTEFTGSGDKNIYQSAGHPFGGGAQFTSDNSGSKIILDSDVEFTVPEFHLNNNTLNCGNHMLTANTTFFDGIIHSEYKVAGNNDFWSSTFTGDFELTGNNRFSNCTVNGTLENKGMMKDITYYGGTFKSYLHLINHHSIQSLNLKIYGNLTNYGTIDNNSIVDVTGNIIQYINMTHTIESPVSFYSDITGNSYQWMKNGQDILNASGVYLYFTSLQLSDAGVYKCRVVKGTGEIVFSREIIVNNVTSVSGNELISGLTASPNPFLNHVTLKWEQKATSHIRIDILEENGKLLQEIANSVYPTGSNQIDIFMNSSLKPGVYFVRILDKDKQAVIKLVR